MSPHSSRLARLAVVDLAQDTGCRSALLPGDDGDAAAVCFDESALGLVDGIEGVVTTLDIDLRPDRVEQWADVFGREDDDGVNAGEAGEDRGAVVLAEHRATGALEQADGFVAVEGEDEEVAELSGGLQIVDVAGMEQVEAAISKGDLPAGVADLADEPEELSQRGELGLPASWMTCERIGDILDAERDEAHVVPERESGEMADEAVSVGPVTRDSDNDVGLTDGTVGSGKDLSLDVTVTGVLVGGSRELEDIVSAIGCVSCGDDGDGARLGVGVGDDALDVDGVGDQMVEDHAPGVVVAERPDDRDVAAGDTQHAGGSSGSARYVALALDAQMGDRSDLRSCCGRCEHEMVHEQFPADKHAPARGICDDGGEFAVGVQADPSCRALVSGSHFAIRVPMPCKGMRRIRAAVDQGIRMCYSSVGASEKRHQKKGASQRRADRVFCIC